MYASLLNFTKDGHRSGSLGTAVNVCPVECISCSLDRPEHTCMNHSQAHQIKRPFITFIRIINSLSFSLRFTNDPLFY